MIEDYLSSVPSDTLDDTVMTVFRFVMASLINSKINAGMIRKRIGFHLKQQTIYKRWLAGLTPGKENMSDPDGITEMAERGMMSTEHDLGILRYIEWLVGWGYARGILPGQLYLPRADCYHDDSYWEKRASGYQCSCDYHS
jgi:hypothetical protein